MTRFQASRIHLAISAAVVGTVLAIVFLIWYPGPTFEIAGAITPVFVLIGVDLVLGPLLTLIVYKEGKPGLKFDLTFIATVQLVALFYGSLTLYSERPHFIVFAVDRITLVAEKDIDSSLIQYEELTQKSIGSLINVFARKPVDGEEFQRFLDSILFEGMPDLERRSEFWEPWESGSDIIRSAIKSLDNFEPASELERQELAGAISRFGSEHPRLGLLPIGGIEEDIGMLLDLDSLVLLDVIRVNPW